MNITIERGMEVALRNSQRLHANLQFADRKAALLIAAASGVLALLKPIIKNSINSDLLKSSAIFSAFILIAGIVMGFFVIWPRGDKNRKRSRGHFCPERIAKFDVSSDFVASANNLSVDDAFMELRELTFDYAHIDKRKYFWLRISVVIMGIGSVMAILVLLLAKSQ